MHSTLLSDMESDTIASDPVWNGLFKTLKDPVILKSLVLLADVLPQMDQLSQFFQRKDVHLGTINYKIIFLLIFLVFPQ